MSVKIWVLHAICAHRKYMAAKKIGCRTASDHRDDYNIALHQARLLKINQ